MQLSPEQQEATDKFLHFLLDDTKKEMVIEGYPGCGKSFLTRHLLDVARSQSNLLRLLSDNSGDMNILKTATTNKAAHVLHGFLHEGTQTIHKALGFKINNNENNGTTSIVAASQKMQGVSNTLIIIDEASYVDTHLLKLIRQNTFNCKVLYIGDRYQLASFKEGVCPVFSDITYKATLKGSKRFTANGAIAQLAEGLRAAVDTGIFPKIVPDGKVIRHVTGPDFQRLVEKEYTRSDFKVNDAKIIAWSNNTVEAYNKHVRKLFTTTEEFAIGEHIISNDYINKDYYSESPAVITDIYSDYKHGVEGWCIELDRKIEVFQPRHRYEVKQLLNAEAQQSKRDRNWKKFFIMKEGFADLRASHACTVYKAQGSTYKKVFINLTDIGKCHQPATVARMLHVAITRASQEVILYGELPYKYRG